MFVRMYQFLKRLIRRICRGRTPTADEVAKCLASSWHEFAEPGFRLRFQELFLDFPLPDEAVFDRLIIGESYWGDFEKLLMSTDSQRWWEMDDEGLREVDVPAFRNIGVGEFKRRPRFNFSISGDTVLIGQHFGPVFIRRVCVVRWSNRSLQLHCNHPMPFGCTLGQQSAEETPYIIRTSEYSPPDWP